MRRWNGWGDDTVFYTLPQHACSYLAEKTGGASPLPEATLDEVLLKVPPSRLPGHPLVIQDAEERVRQCRGQSLPDWLALKSGNIDAFPNGIAYPTTTGEVQSLLSYAEKTGAIIIPYGGCTSVVGHINPEPGERPILTVYMSRMNRLVSLDDESRLATFQAGAAGPDLEAQLRAKGYTLGHFPQSFECSTFGGWIATRSSGQQSLWYGGRIEKFFTGGMLVSPEGPLEIPAFPASAAGPDLREIVLGSEGRLGILTEAKVRISPLPERERFRIVFFPHWDAALDSVRETVQEGIPLSMLRLGSALETETQLALAGHERVISLLEKLLTWRGVGSNKCMLLFGVTGTRASCRSTLRRALRVFRHGDGIHVGSYGGRKWAESRFLIPYLRNTLWDKGYAVDTLETAADWQNVNRTVEDIESALHGAFGTEAGPVLVLTHLSHLYPQGSSIYITVIFRAAKTYEDTFRIWKCLKTAASKAIVKNRGTISHQHGVGIDHEPYLAAEKGRLGIAAIKAICDTFDPHGIMNPGKLLR
jgi:alkyldihydroxyacetonephosphate synthase